MKKNLIYQNFDRTLQSILFLVFFIFLGCKSSQPTAPLQTVILDSLHFSSFEIDLHNITGIMHHNNHEYGMPKDTIYNSNDSLFDVYGFVPRHRSIDKFGTITQSYDTSTSDCKGTYSTGHYTSLRNSVVVSLDTANNFLSSFIFDYYSSSSYDGCACLGCGSGSRNNSFFIHIKKIPITYSVGQNIIVKILSADLVSEIDSLSKSISSYDSQGYNGPSRYSSTSLIGLNPFPSDAYIKITLRR